MTIHKKLFVKPCQSDEDLKILQNVKDSDDPIAIYVTYGISSDTISFLKDGYVFSLDLQNDKKDDRRYEAMRRLFYILEKTKKIYECQLLNIEFVIKSLGRYPFLKELVDNIIPELQQIKRKVVRGITEKGRK